MKNSGYNIVRILAAIAASLSVLAGCMGAWGEVELRPPSREGMFNTIYAEVAKDAADNDKLILMEFWRPG